MSYVIKINFEEILLLKFRHSYDGCGDIDNSRVVRNLEKDRRIAANRKLIENNPM